MSPRIDEQKEAANRLQGELRLLPDALWWEVLVSSLKEYASEQSVPGGKRPTKDEAIDVMQTVTAAIRRRLDASRR